LEKFFCTETVVGEPITVGEIVLVPIIEISFGLGSGGGSGKDTKGNDGTGGGAGVGAKITPNAIMVIKGGEVSLMPLKNRGSMEKVLEMVPDIVEKFKNMKFEAKKTKGE
ncbi:MAG: spore germination protein GerW family protein, partial [Clostridia bacterium]|nr:spore germination protein GerW family protein [Clostridia bacterium]